MAYEKTVWVNGQAPALDADHLNKIEQGIADAVSVTPQTLTDAQKAQARENINALGEDHAHIADCNLVTKSGIYRVDANTENAPSYLTPGLGHLLIVAAWDVNTLVQMYFAPSIGCEFIRYTSYTASGFSWQPWECVNPLMQMGVEYRTTERYLGKPVYASLKRMGACSAGEFITSNAGLASVAKIVSVSGFTEGAGTGGSIALPHLYGVPGTSDFTRYSISLSAMLSGSGNGDVVIGIGCGEARSFSSADVLLKYTKTTD